MPSLLREMQSMHPDNIIDVTTIEEDDNVPSNLPVGSVPAEVHDSPTYADIAGRTDRQQSPELLCRRPHQRLRGRQCGDKRRVDSAHDCIT